jgi:hypothetical protein
MSLHAQRVLRPPVLPATATHADVALGLSPSAARRSPDAALPEYVTSTAARRRTPVPSPALLLCKTTTSLHAQWRGAAAPPSSDGGARGCGFSTVKALATFRSGSLSHSRLRQQRRPTASATNQRLPAMRLPKSPAHHTAAPPSPGRPGHPTTAHPAAFGSTLVALQSPRPRPSAWLLPVLRWLAARAATTTSPGRTRRRWNAWWYVSGSSDAPIFWWQFGHDGLN